MSVVKTSLFQQFLIHSPHPLVHWVAWSRALDFSWSVFQKKIGPLVNLSDFLYSTIWGIAYGRKKCWLSIFQNLRPFARSTLAGWGTVTGEFSQICTSHLDTRTTRSQHSKSEFQNSYLFIIPYHPSNISCFRGTLLCFEDHGLPFLTLLMN